MKSYTATAMAALAGGCASLSGQTSQLLSDLSQPVATTPNEWAINLPDAPAEGDWIKQFGSPAMYTLIDEALSANQSLKSAQATTKALRAQARAARGARVPSLSAGASASSSFYGDGLPLSDGESFGVNLSSSWEADIWGRVAKSAAAAEQDYAASKADLADIRLSLAGRTASSWISLSNAIAQLALARDELEVRSRSRELTEKRVAAGLSTTLDVRLTRSAEASARSGIASAELAVEDAARTLEILLGRYPSAEIKAPPAPPSLGKMSDLSSPAELLARRPDIASAEARMVASGLRADLARIAMRPALSLSASGSIDSTEIEDLLDFDLIAGRVLANLTAPIFTGGRLSAQADAARANAEAAAANYAQAALSAWQEVEGARAADLSLSLQEAATLVALEEAQAAEILAERQYQQGLITIFNLIDAQSRRISAERQLISTRAQRAINRINYHIALGGDDWLPATHSKDQPS